MLWKSEVIVYEKLIFVVIVNLLESVLEYLMEETGKLVVVIFIGITTDMSQACGCGKWKTVKDKEDWERQKESDYKSLKSWILGMKLSKNSFNFGEIPLTGVYNDSIIIEDNIEDFHCLGGSCFCVKVSKEETKLI